MKLKLLVILFITQVTFSQRTCGTDSYMQVINQNPNAKLYYTDLQKKFDIELQKLENKNSVNKNAMQPNATIRIPVAVHYPTAGSASAALKTCLRNLAQTQINILNADYNATNSDISLWSSASSFYPGTNYGSLNVEFVLATQNHPAGTGLANGDLAVTFGTDFLTAGTPNCTDGCNLDDTWAGYCNLVVTNISGGILGFSPLGGSPSQGMTVVIDNNAFGATMTTSPATCTGFAPSAPYNKGRTLTHELGHFFNLSHTFQACDGANCATSGDKVCDTPPANTAYYDCVDPGSVPTTCGSIPQLTMNYMDYVQDACMYMFTVGQANRMQAWYNAIASQLHTNVLSNNEVLAHNFFISPNPSKGLFTVSLEKELDNYSIQILDATGKLIVDNEYLNDSSLSKNIVIPNAQSGLYFITIKASDMVVTKKLVVE